MEVCDVCFMITKYEQIDKQQWAELVLSSKTATWFQTVEAYEFYASLPELFYPFVVAVTPSDSHKGGERLVGVVVGYVTREKNALKQFATRRAIIIGGPLLADDAGEDEVTELLNGVKSVLCAKEKSVLERPIFIETRNFHDYSRWRKAFEQCGWKYEEHLDLQVDCETLEKVHSSMSESRLRQVKKALKNGARIEEAGSVKEIYAYYEILQHLYKTKVKTPLFPFDFFQTFYEKNLGKYFLVKNDLEIIGGILCPIIDNRTIYEWFVCGKDTEYKNLYPSVLATYAAIQYAAENHIAMFDFMGAGKPGDKYGVRDFKEPFGGRLVEFGRNHYICHPLLYTIGKIGVWVLKIL